MSNTAKVVLVIILGFGLVLMIAGRDEKQKTNWESMTIRKNGSSKSPN